jgi:hypothetical protein
MSRGRSLLGGLAVLSLVLVAGAQPPGGPGPGFGGPMGQQRKLVKQFDRDGDGRLNAEERKAAREFIKKERAARGPGGFGPGVFGPPPQPGQILPAFLRDGLELTAEQRKQVDALQKEVDEALARLLTEGQKKQLREMGRGPGPGGFGPPGGFGGRENREPARPGPQVNPAGVKAYPDAGLYDPAVLRTLFLEFEHEDWEEELADFKGTDVEVPCTLLVDGKKYRNVGVHFRGMSSYMMVRPGHKRSLNLSLDFVDVTQRLEGYKTLNLLNSSDDPSLLSTVLYSHIARKHIPAPRANFAKVVINGESWGVYVNAQQFNKEFVEEHFKGGKGARWKVRGSPGGGGGLDYLGEDVAAYRRRYELKSKEDDKAWKDLVGLCRTLNQTPLDRLEDALKPILDLEGVLWFLALDVALQNDDGYWIRASDYSLFRDAKGKFHLIPSDMNEAFKPAMGFGRGPGAGRPSTGADLDPLVALNDARKPLRSRLLAVPSLKARYLAHVRTIAEQDLDWKTLGPVVAASRALIEKEVESDTRKLYSAESFTRATADKVEDAGPQNRRMSLRAFADARRKFLLDHPEVSKAGRKTENATKP